MLEREPVGAVVLALKKAGGVADARQLSATTGLAQQRIMAELRWLASRGLVVEAGSVWQLVQVA